MAFNYTFSKCARHFHLFLKRNAHLKVASLRPETYKVKKKKDPFMKNLLVGIVDKELLIFPEVQSSEETSLLESALLPTETNAVSNEVPFMQLLKSGICKLGFSTEYGGIPCDFSILLEEIKNLDMTPITSYILQSQYSLIIENLVTYGSKQQKDKYLSDLMSGKIIGAYAAYEDGSGSDAASIECVASTNDTDDKSFNLNGMKSWVSNANMAKFFIVLAHIKDSSSFKLNRDLLSAFLIDRETPGISVTTSNKINGCDVCQVKFDNVLTSKDNLLGNLGDGHSIYMSTFESNKFIFTSTIINVIRKMLCLVADHVSKISRTPVPFRDYELTQFRLAKVVSTLYALESSVYLLAGMQDHYKMDTSYESIIVQNLVYTYGNIAINECLNIVGTQAFDTSNVFKSLTENLSLLLRSFSCPEMLNLYTALKAVEHAGNTYKDRIFKSRNPLNYPTYIVKHMFNARRQINDNPKLDKNLYMEYHPSLKASADNLEYCVSRMEYVIELLLIEFGKDLVHRQMPLIKVGEAVGDIFTMIAVLARASRSYCTGIRHSDEEKSVAIAWCAEAKTRIQACVSDVTNSHSPIRNHSFLKLSQDVLSNKGYFYASPLEKNIQ